MAYAAPYQTQEMPSGMPALPNTNVPSAAAAGLAGLSANLNESAKILQMGADRAAMSDAYAQLSSVKENAITTAEQLRDSMPDDPTGYTENVHAAYVDQSNKVLDSVQNPRARQFLQMHLN